MRGGKALKAALALLGVFLVFYIGYQVYMAVSPSYKTQIAIYASVSDSVTVSGIVARDETLVDVGQDVTAGYRAPDGEKIASGAAAADIYPSAGAAMDSLRSERLSAEVEALESASDSGRTAGSNLKNLRARIYDELEDMSFLIERSDYGGAFYYSLDMLELLSSYATASGGEVDFSAALAEYGAALDAVGAGDFSSSTVYTPVEGYFISSADGYEDEVDMQALLDLDSAGIIALAEAQPPERPQGKFKVVSDYEWYYAAVMSGDDAARLAVGEEVSVEFSYSLAQALPMTVVRVCEPAPDGRTAVVLECDRLNSSLCSLRVETARVNFGEYAGLKISRSALRMLDGALGVYVKYGTAVEFRRVDVIYETDDYVISRADPEDGELLADYDEVITEGRDIYEGKQLGKVNIG